MTPEYLLSELNSSEEYFERSTRCLSEEHSTFTPSQNMMSAAQQVAHCAVSIDWFADGAVSPSGFSMDFEAHERQVRAVTSLAVAREMLKKAFEHARSVLGALDAEALAKPMAPGPVMGGAPVWTVISGIVDHTAHHRGALTVYSRLLGLAPKMPYMEM